MRLGWHCGDVGVVIGGKWVGADDDGSSSWGIDSGFLIDDSGDSWSNAGTCTSDIGNGDGGSSAGNRGDSACVFGNAVERVV